ncbi:NOL1/NOP2/sun family protein [Streptococcus agalactiae 515]|nr:NOL1/NOP2/sun family protein [Streptococcus agalactiae 515]
MSSLTTFPDTYTSNCSISISIDCTRSCSLSAIPKANDGSKRFFLKVPRWRPLRAIFNLDKSGETIR